MENKERETESKIGCCMDDVDEEVKQNKYRCPTDNTMMLLHLGVKSGYKGLEKQDLLHCPNCHKDFQPDSLEK